MKTPEFDIFGRVEQLEKKLKGELTVNDAFVVALLGFRMAYMAFSLILEHDIDDFDRKLLETTKYYGLNSKLTTTIAAELDSMRATIKETRKLRKKKV